MYKEDIKEQSKFCYELHKRLQKDIKEMQSMDGHTRIQSDIKRLRRELLTLYKMLSR